VACELFHNHFPALAEAETRTLYLRDGSPGPDRIPDGDYSFVEAYCTDPKCDCRRVLLNVLKRDEGIVGVISFAFDPDAPMRGPFFDPLHPRPSYADEFLELMNDVVLSDPAYVARLERHYEMVKAKCGESAPPRRSGRRPKKPKRPRRWTDR
jgi:hypothetical protein